MPVTMDVTITDKGVEDFFASLRSIPGAVEVLLKDVAIELRRRVENRTPVGDPKRDKHAGQLKKSWSSVQSGVEGASFSFSTNVDYATVVEQGGYKGIGPRTVRFGAGIYSRQAPGGMIQPIIEDTSLIERLVKEVVDALVVQLNA